MKFDASFCFFSFLLFMKYIGQAYEMEEKFLQQQARLEELSLPPDVSHWYVYASLTKRS